MSHQTCQEKKGRATKEGIPTSSGPPLFIFADFRAVASLPLRLFGLLLPEDAPQELPGPRTARPRGAGQLVDELDLAWQLIDRDLALAELDQLLFQCLRALLSRFELD